MPQLRKDPILKQWVIISPERGKRPSDFKKVETAAKPVIKETKEIKKWVFRNPLYDEINNIQVDSTLTS